MEAETAWDGDEYQQRFDALAASGVDVHGEAELVLTFAPTRVLDAGCGTGRVASELARRGIAVVGVDRDPSMLATARARDPRTVWHEHDLATLDLGEEFDVVVLAGNVPLFTEPDGRAALVAGCARHVGAQGRLVAGFQLGRGYDLADHDRHAAAAGLTLESRFATWERSPWPGDGSYAVSVHRRVP